MALKMETLKLLLALEDVGKLQRVRAMLTVDGPTPQVLLDLIQRRQEAARTDEGTPVEEYLEEIKHL